MSFFDWVRETLDRYRDQPFVPATQQSTVLFLCGVAKRIEAHRTFGRDIYADEWDTCVVLDACRHDLYESVCGSTPSAYSVGEVTVNWIDRTFDAERAAETVYVTANPHSRRAEALPWERFVPVWIDGWDDDLETVPPETMTRYALAARRQHPDARLVLHYMQPHHPFTPAGYRLGGTLHADDHVWNRLEAGELDRDTVWEAYAANLRVALDSVDVLLDGLDDETVLLTSDHGNAMGEWGMYGHPPGLFIPAVRKVPWRTTETGSSRPTDLDTDLSLEPQRPSTDIDDRLAALGYVD